MNIDVYDNNLVRQMNVGGMFASCYWQEAYNDEGIFTLELPPSNYVKQKIRPDYFIKRQDRKAIMVVKTIGEAENGNLIIQGKTASSCLDDVAFVGNINANSEIVQSIYDAYESTDRYPDIYIEPNTEINDVYGEEISNKSILSLMQTMYKSADIGYRTEKNGPTIDVISYKPGIRNNLIFSAERGNITKPRLTISTENYKNYAIVLGKFKRGDDTEVTIRADVDFRQGEEIKREILVETSERQLDAETEEEYFTRIKQFGVEELITRKEIANAIFTPISAGFGTLFDLGDIVAVNMNDYGLQVRARITKYALTQQIDKSIVDIGVGETKIIRR